MRFIYVHVKDRCIHLLWAATVLKLYQFPIPMKKKMNGVYYIAYPPIWIHSVFDWIQWYVCRHSLSSKLFICLRKESNIEIRMVHPDFIFYKSESPWESMYQLYNSSRSHWGKYILLCCLFRGRTKLQRKEIRLLNNLLPKINHVTCNKNRRPTVHLTASCLLCYHYITSLYFHAVFRYVIAGLTELARN